MCTHLGEKKVNNWVNNYIKKRKEKVCVFWGGRINKRFKANLRQSTGKTGELLSPVLCDPNKPTHHKTRVRLKQAWKQTTETYADIYTWTDSNIPSYNVTCEGRAWFKNSGGCISKGPKWCWFNTAYESSKMHYRKGRQPAWKKAARA